MKRWTDRAIRIGLLVLAAVVLLGAALWQPFDVAQGKETAVSYTLSWWTADSGGTTASRGENGHTQGYTLGGTAGQPDAARRSGEGYTLASGFWTVAAVDYLVYLPLVIR